MKHVTYYLLVSISFPYIHTRQIGHDEGPQLLVIGELEWETQGIRGLGWAVMSHGGRLAASEPPKRSTVATLESPYYFHSNTHPLPPKPKHNKTVSSFHHKTITHVMGNSGNRKEKPVTLILPSEHTTAWSILCCLSV